MTKKLLWLLLISSLISVNFVSAYEEIECSTDAIFESYSCNQCFDWWAKAQWDYIWLLIDDWINPSDKKQILFKEEQKMPELYNLNPNSVTWSQTPSSEWFWEYTQDFDNLYSESELWYVLNPWQRVTWLQSKLNYAYKLDSNSVAANWNIGLLAYPISTHIIQDDGSTSIDNDEHVECVLFKSAWASVAPVVEQPKKLPDTGPTEYILLLIIAMFLGFGFVKLSTRS